MLGKSLGAGKLMVMGKRIKEMIFRKEELRKLRLELAKKQRLVSIGVGAFIKRNLVLIIDIQQQKIN